MRRAMVITVLLFFPASAFTQQQESLDLESLVGDVDELGVPTVSKVQALRESAEALAEGGDCEAAIPALESWAKAANQLANFLRIGLDPFYDASRDDRDAFRRTAGKNFKKYVEIEGQANGYLRQRNTAMVLQAECQARVGNLELAASLYYRVLDLISLNSEEQELWHRAREGLYRILGAEG